jgi:tetratricopeptide (TPR) repeat protein
LHRRVFDLLLPAASPAILIHHALEGEVQNWEQVSTLAIRAGDTSMELFAVRDAIYYYELARQFRPVLASDAPYVLKLARAFELNAQAAQAQALYEQLLLQTDLAVPFQITTLNRLATLFAQSFDTTRAVELLQRALVAAHTIGDELLRAETQWGLAQITYYGGDFDPAYIYAEGSLKWARELQNPDLIARNLNLLAYIHSVKGTQQAAIARAEEAAALYAQMGNRALEMDSLAIKANALLRYGETESALALAEYVLQVCRQLENPWGQVSCLLQIAQGLLDRGDISEAVQNSEAALRIGTQLQIPLLVPFAKITLALARRAEARWEEAIQLLREALEAGISPEGAARVKAEICATYAFEGHWEEAASYALQLPEVRIHPLMLVERHIELEVEALVRGDHRKAAAQLIEQFSRTAGDSLRYRDRLSRARAVYEEYTW